MRERPLPVLSFVGKLADHNGRAMAAVPLLAAELCRRTGTVANVIGTSRAVTNHGWRSELSDGMAEMRSLSAALDAQLAQGGQPVLVMSRNTVALGTLPVFASRNPHAVLVWIGADASLNTPKTSRTGYLGGMVLSAVTGLWDSGLGSGVALSHIATVGTRDLEPVEEMLIAGGVMGLVQAPGEPVESLRQFIAGRPVYVHFACDVFEPGIVPTDYQIPGGLTLDDVRLLAEMLAECDVRGVQLAELEVPTKDSNTDHVGVLLDALWPLIRACTMPQVMGNL